MIEATLEGVPQVLARFERMGPRIRAQLVAAMQRQWNELQTATVTERLSGDPLRRRTGVLASSLSVGGRDTASQFTEATDSIVARVGTRVRYGAVHENGGTFQVPEHTRRIAQVFGRAVAEHTITVRSHPATFPQRAFLRPTLREREGRIREAIAAAVAEADK